MKLPIHQTLWHRWFAAFVSALLFTTLLASGPVAEAHMMPANRETINVVDHKAYLIVSIPVGAFEAVEACSDGALTATELQKSKRALRRVVRSHIHLQSNRQKATFREILFSLPSGYGHNPNQSEELIVMIVARFPTKPGPVTFGYDLWTPNPEPLKIQTTVSEGRKTLQSETGVLSRNTPSYEFFASKSNTFLTWIYRGTTHLLGGADHLVFLLILLLASIKVRRWQVLMSSFALAYGAAMTFAALGGPAPSTVVVEIGIAFSIAALALLFLHKPKVPLRVEIVLAVGFGLVHGLGFSEVLQENTHLPVVKLLGFNVGAALGQLLVAALLFGIALVLRKQCNPKQRHQIAKVVLALSLVFGLVCTVERTQEAIDNPTPQTHQDMHKTLRPPPSKPLSLTPSSHKFSQTL